MTEPTEIQLARMDERLKMVLDRMEENHESHVKARSWMGQIDRNLSDISFRVASVESSLAKTAPTIEEFMVIKNKVIGAGMAGRWIWVGVGSLLTLIIAGREQIAAFLFGRGV